MTPGKLGVGVREHVKLPITQNGWEPRNLQVPLKATQGDYLLPDWGVAVCVFLFVCLYCVSVRPAYQLNLGKRWKEGWPNRHLLIATHKSSIPDLSTWLVCQIPVPTGKLRPRSDIDVSYLALSSHVDSGSNISLLADPSALPFGLCGVQFKWSCLVCRSRILLVLHPQVIAL